MARYSFRNNLDVAWKRQRPNFDSGVSGKVWPIWLQFVWFGVSFVASILINGYEAMARYPFWINLGWFCVISKKGSDDFGIPHSASYLFFLPLLRIWSQKAALHALKILVFSPGTVGDNWIAFAHSLVNVTCHCNVSIQSAICNNKG